MRALSSFLAASGALALLLSSPAAAAPVASTTTGKAAVLKSLSVIKRADLDFGALVVSTAGTAVIDPVSGAITVTGSIVPVGMTAHPATFTATGSRNSVVIIKLPSSAITLTRVGGGGTMTVSNWTLDGKPNRKIPLNNAFNFNVGATLNIGAGQADGTYAGTFAVTVQYP